MTCFRVYDADLPEYAAAVDLYEEAGTGRRLAHVQEYAPPASIDPEAAALRLDEIVGVIPDVFGVAPDDVAVKVRRRQRGHAQYERQAATGEFIEVAEGGLRFLVNLRDYLDTGIFLDHRPVRALGHIVAEHVRVDVDDARCRDAVYNAHEDAFSFVKRIRKHEWIRGVRTKSGGIVAAVTSVMSSSGSALASSTKRR